MVPSEKLEFLATLWPFVGVVFIITAGVVLLTQQFRKNLYRQQLLQEEMKNKHQTELLRASILAQEDERKRIARDLHDEIGAVLSITRMHTIQLERKGDGQINPESLQNIRHLLETAITNMRRISYQLMPHELEVFGLIKALETIAIQVNKTRQIVLDVHTTGDCVEIGWQPKLALYRICLELVNNSLKHSGATHLKIELKREEHSIQCCFSDNGIGLKADNLTTGIGLKSIEGRVKSLGGTFALGKAEGGGFFAYIRISLQFDLN